MKGLPLFSISRATSIQAISNMIPILASDRIPRKIKDILTIFMQEEWQVEAKPSQDFVTIRKGSQAGTIYFDGEIFTMSGNIIQTADISTENVRSILYLLKII